MAMFIMSLDAPGEACRLKVVSFYKVIVLNYD